MQFLLTIVLSISLITNSAIGDEVKRISSVKEFIKFSGNVNGGNTYEGTTVFLDSDLDLTGKTFEPIGSSFLGTFDGQGHVISNFKIDSSLQYAGLFGYSHGLTIRNVILDSSCSIASSYTSDSAYVGGIIGQCYASKGSCTIANSVNMASVSFTGSTSSNNYLYFGGIVGSLISEYYDAAVKNCANYGGLTHSGRSSHSLIGGVVGYSYEISSEVVYIRNSINYGIITHSGTSSDELIIGGIVGVSTLMVIENCVSAGKISSTGTASNSRIGSMIGWIPSRTSIKYCYITSDLSSYSKYGSGNDPSTEYYILNYTSTTFELSEAASIGEYTGTSLIDALNAYIDYDYVLYSHWLLNKNSNAVSFIINGRTAPISMNYQIILTPNLANGGGMSFDGWYEDSALTTPLTSYEVTSNTELYGKLEGDQPGFSPSFYHPSIIFLGLLALLC